MTARPISTLTSEPSLAQVESVRSRPAGSRGLVYSQDDRVIERVQRGEHAAYLELFDRYYARVESYARWRLRNADAASDMASETFLRAYRSIGGYRLGTGSAYLAYLLQICRRLIGAERTRGYADAMHSLQQAAEESRRQAADYDVPIVLLLEEERRAMIQAAVQCLPDDDREIIHLAFERDLSRRDIAEILGKPSVSAVTSHLYRAVQKLRAIVLRQGYFTPPEHAERR